MDARLALVRGSWHFLGRGIRFELRLLAAGTERRILRFERAPREIPKHTA